jgi:hypothetical protein
MLTLFTTITLLFAPPPPTVLDPGDEPKLDYAAAIAQMTEAEQLCNTHPSGAIDSLTETLAALVEFAPELAGDDSARTLRQDSRLCLARAHMLAKHDDLAAAVMDEVVRAAMGETVPAAAFGPSLEQLYLQRAKALEDQGRASLSVNCGMDCKIYVDEREVGSEPLSLLLGSYRVWIVDTTGKRPALREVVEFTEVGQLVELEFAPIKRPPPPPPPPEPVARKLPRWAEVALIVTGVGLTTTGAVLLGVSGGNGGKAGLRAGGAVSMLFGVATLLPGAITLSVDERRVAGKREHQAMVSWTMRF